jgi:hypothetical protein
MRTDNSTADGIMNKTVKQKQSKSMDMRFYWLQDRVEQGQFKKNWAPGKINLADYHSKVQPTLVHRTLRPIYLYEKDNSKKNSSKTRTYFHTTIKITSTKST